MITEFPDTNSEERKLTLYAFIIIVDSVWILSLGQK